MRRLFVSAFDCMAGVIDDAFLTLPKILKPFHPRREIDLDAYARQIHRMFRAGHA
jgi:hypothetical protein